MKESLDLTTQNFISIPYGRIPGTGGKATPDLTGLKFGRLTAISISAEKGTQGRTQWICECKCDESTTNIVTVAAINLRNGCTKSCGCLYKDNNVILGKRCGEHAKQRYQKTLIRDLKFLKKKDVSELKYGDVRENGMIYIGVRRGIVCWLKPEKFLKNEARRKLRNAVRMALKRGGFVKNNKAEYLLCAPIDFVRNYITSQFTEGMSWENHGHDTWHLDHILAMAYGKTQEEMEILCHYSNLCPLPGPENLEKSDTLPPDADEQFAILKARVEEYRAKNPQK